MDYPTKIKELESICREKSLRLTQQKRTVLEEIVSRHDHPTADLVLAEVRKKIPDISRATVYRILEFFVQEGVIQKICHPGSAAHYDARTEQHHHVVCRECSKVMDVEVPKLDEIDLPDKEKNGFKIECHSVYFRGICPNCQELVAG